MTDPHPDLERWNRKFDRPDHVFGEDPNVFLVEQAAALPPGRALAVADGEGRNGVWLAGQGWDVRSFDLSPVGIAKARALAKRRGVVLALEQADAHAWDYPEAAFDLVIDIFTQFSNSATRPLKWNGMIRALRPGGTLIVVGYTPDQPAYGTGGPKDPDHLYTAPLLRRAFDGLRIVTLEEGVRDLREGPGHSGRSAVIGMVACKPGRA